MKKAVNIFSLIVFIGLVSGCGVLSEFRQSTDSGSPMSSETVYDYSDNPQTVTEFQIQPTYNQHLQGIDIDEDSRTIYSIFTDAIVRSDYVGNVLQEVYLDGDSFDHLGDPEVVGDYLYVPQAVKFNVRTPSNNMYIYNKHTLELEDIVPIKQVKLGSGAVTYLNGYFYVCGGILPEMDYNLVYKYDQELNYVRKYRIYTGATWQGVQTLFTDGTYIYVGVKDGYTFKLLLDAERDEFGIVETIDQPSMYGAIFTNKSAFYAVSRQVGDKYGIVLYMTGVFGSD